MTKMKSALPKRPDQNGLDQYARAFVSEPETERVAVVLLDCVEVLHDVEEDVDIPTVRIKAVEVLKGVDADQARLMLRETADKRLGRPATLDLRTASGLHITRSADTA